MGLHACYCCYVVMFLNTSWGHGDTRTRSSIRLGEILTNRLVIHISRRLLPRASQKVKFRHNIRFSLNHETPAGLSHILGYQSSLRQAQKLPGSTGQSGIRLITATRLSASTAPELALDGRLPLPPATPELLGALSKHPSVTGFPSSCLAIRSMIFWRSEPCTGWSFRGGSHIHTYIYTYI